MKLRKVLLWTGGILLGLILVVWLGGWGLLKSPFARKTAADELTKILGVPVEVDELDVGTGGTSAAIRIPDPGGGNLVRIGSLDTDITLGSLLGGNASPTFVNASDVEFLLRLDENGNILSPLPKGNGNPPDPNRPIPDIRVSGGTVRIRQAGKEEFALSGLTAHLRREGDGYALDGDVDDPRWGKWKVGGRLTADFADGHLALTTDRAELKDELLRTIPYVPAVVWENLTAAGPTTASVRFTFRKDADLGYEVDLHPQKAALTLPAAGVTLSDVTGRIRVADGKVTVTDGAVAVAGGSGTVSGEYVYYVPGVAGTNPTEPMALITVKAAAAGLDMQRLPEKWKLPKDITGKLKGTADLQMRVSPEGELATLGGGEAEVVDAKIRGLESAKIDEFKLKLVGGNGEYRFEDTR